MFTHSDLASPSFPYHEDPDKLDRLNNDEMITDRSLDADVRVLQIIRDLGATGEAKLSMKEITTWFVDRHRDDYERTITPKWIGGIVRTKLNLRTQKSNGVYVIPREEHPKLARLYEKYGIQKNSETE